MVSSNFSFFPLPFRADLLCFSSTAVVSNNVIGPAGQSYGTGPIADGISLACENSIVQDNELFGELSSRRSFLPPSSNLSLTSSALLSHPHRYHGWRNRNFLGSWIPYLGKHHHCHQRKSKGKEKEPPRRTERFPPFFPSPVCHARRNQHGRLRSLLWKL